MGVLQSLGNALKTAAEQITTQSPTPRDLHFTNNFQLKAKSFGLSEKDARDVYYHGSQVKSNMMVKKYNGYEIGIWFFKDHLTGQAIITSIWKRGRR
jgi:hypothetical protein